MVVDKTCCMMQKCIAPEGNAAAHRQLRRRTLLWRIDLPPQDLDDME